MNIQLIRRGARNFTRNMKKLENTKCEVRRTTDLQYSNLNRFKSSAEDEGPGLADSSDFDGCDRQLGNFFEDGKYAWLSNGPKLVVINAKSGTSISSWTFRYRVTCVSPFPAQPGHVPLLLVGLDNDAKKMCDSQGVVCIFNCGSAKVLRAIQMPAGVEQLCIVSGGAGWEDTIDHRSIPILPEPSGLACVALRNLYHVFLDVRRTSWEGPDSTIIFDESNPADISLTTYTENSLKCTRERHAAYNLMNSQLEINIGRDHNDLDGFPSLHQSSTSALVCSLKIGCLISGCLGRIIIWQMDGALRWVSTLTEENMSVSHVALLEPSDDPLPCCYLWSSFENQTNPSTPILRMYSMLFERKYTDKNTNAYLNLESNPSLKFGLELDDAKKITNLYPIIRESGPKQADCRNKRDEESLLLIGMDIRTILFDLNQWYHEQMPHTIGECQNPNTFLSSYRTHPENARGISEYPPIDIAYAKSSLKQFTSNIPSPPGEFFFPNSLALQWLELAPGRIITRRTRGVQAELLREILLTGPVILIEPTEIYTRCFNLALTPFDFGVSFNSDKDVQREILFSICLEQRWSQFLSRCAKDWSNGSAAYLFTVFIRWAMQRSSTLKLTADRLCIPLFDHSGTSLGEAELKTLRLISQQLDCIANVVASLIKIDTTYLSRESRVLRRVSTYLKVLLWFCDVGLLPESHEIDEEHPIAYDLNIPYPYERLAGIYQDKRSRSSDDTNLLFIDELVSRECLPLRVQWTREGGEICAGKYPPSSLQSLLRIYLTDCYEYNSTEMENKHQITIYLLMDLAMILQTRHPGVDQLIKYSSAFKLSPSLVKLTQALWHLDHEKYQEFFDMMTGQLVSENDVKDWHHKHVLRTLIRNNQNKLALTYLRARKPPSSSLDDQTSVVSLTVEHALVQSAFHRQPPVNYTLLLTRFFQVCKLYGKLDDVLHLALKPEEERAFVKFLENGKSEDTRLLYYLQRSRYAEANNVYSRSRTMLEVNNKTVITILNAYSATPADIQKKFTNNVGKRSLEIQSEPKYPMRPMSHWTCRGSTQDVHDLAVKKANEISDRRVESWNPFISTPCAMRTGVKTIDLNCTIVEKTFRKRRFEDREDTEENRKRRKIDKDETLKREIGMLAALDTNCTIVERTFRKRRLADREDSGEDRKRRKMEKEETPKREIGMIAGFDTLLAMRKIQAMNAISTPIKTPHSILAISRQMIRESTSPSGTAKREEDKGKPRQIRFSIGQRKADEPMDEESDEADSNEKTNGVTFFCPNGTEMDSTSEISILTDDSSYASNVIALRSRPSLRRGHFESQLFEDLRQKSLMNSVQKKISRGSTIEQAAIASVSIYSESILSSDTSYEFTRYADDKRGESIENRHEFAVEYRKETSEKPVEDEHFRDYAEIHYYSSIVAESQPIQKTILEIHDAEPDDDDKISEDEEFMLKYDEDGQDCDSEESQSLQNSVDMNTRTSVSVVAGINEVNVTDDESSRFSACNFGDGEILKKTVSLKKECIENETLSITNDESDIRRGSAIFSLKIPEEWQVEGSEFGKPKRKSSVITRDVSVVRRPIATTRVKRASSSRCGLFVLETPIFPESAAILSVTGKTSRSQRAFSIFQEVVSESTKSPESPTAFSTLRSQRGNLMAKDISATTSAAENSVKKGRSGKYESLTKMMVKELPARRSARERFRLLRI